MQYIALWCIMPWSIVMVQLYLLVSTVLASLLLPHPDPPPDHPGLHHHGGLRPGGPVLPACPDTELGGTGEGVAGPRSLLVLVTGLTSTLGRRGRGPGGSPHSATTGGGAGGLPGPGRPLAVPGTTARGTLWDRRRSVSRTALQSCLASPSLRCCISCRNTTSLHPLQAMALESGPARVGRGRVAFVLCL